MSKALENLTYLSLCERREQLATQEALCKCFLDLLKGGSVGQALPLDKHLTYRRLPHGILGQIFRLDTEGNRIQVEKTWIETELDKIHRCTLATMNPISAEMARLDDAIKALKDAEGSETDTPLEEDTDSEACKDGD